MLTRPLLHKPRVFLNELEAEFGFAAHEAFDEFFGFLHVVEPVRRAMRRDRRAAERVRGLMASRNCAGIISPRPLKRLISTFRAR